MAVIKVPRPKKSAVKLDRPVSSLLLAHVQHMQRAEKNLPLQYRSGKYIKAITTEREAAEYIEEVTEEIHRAHDDALKHRVKRKATSKKHQMIVDAAKHTPRKEGRRRATAKKATRKKQRQKK
jgi:hypothetical protein